MTDLRHSPDPPIDPRFAIVEAFADGERVDPDALRAALADEMARDHFIGVVMMRDAIVGREPEAFATATSARRRSTSIRWFGAAAVIALSIVGGYVAGQRVVVPVDAAAVEAVIDVNDTPAAPPATRSVAFEPGVNWTDGPGGR